MNNSDHKPRKKRDSFHLPNIVVNPFDNDLTTARDPLGAELRKPVTLIVNEPNT